MELKINRKVDKGVKSRLEKVQLVLPNKRTKVLRISANKRTDRIKKELDKIINVDSN